MDARLSDPVAIPVPPQRLRRTIDGISAVLLPFDITDGIDWTGYHALLERTWAAGLRPAVNMDTGYVNLLTPDERSLVLREVANAARGRPFVAGAYVEDSVLEPVTAYRRAIDEIRRHGGTPILFQCSAIADRSEADVLSVYRDAAADGGPLLAFELGTMFAPFGRVYSLDFVERLLDIPAFTGMKHSSLDRALEWRRIELRDQCRPGFHIYTGNDLAIDMVFYGSDYLLGLSTFAVEAFAARDRCWAAGDGRALGINDVLQYLGNLAFRAPVPAYKHSAAQFLKLRGIITSDHPHPRSPRRPASDVPLLEEILQRLESGMQGVGA